MKINQKFMEEIRVAEQYAPLRTELEQIYAEFDEEIPVLRFADFMDFRRTGNRMRFEERYFARRKQMNYTVLYYLLYGRAEDIRRLQNILWAICDEYTWALPAHINTPWELEHEEITVDLFAAETGFAFCEILDLLGDQLDEELAFRMRREIKRRIVDSFMGHRYHWEGLEMNWASVCGGSVGACFLYAFPELFPLVQDRILKIMDTFLRGFGEDGCCREGVGYWSYGFGYFVYFADLLKTHTQGEINLFEKEMVRKAAAFQQRIALNPNTVISFSDCADFARIRPGLTSYLKQIYPDAVRVPELPQDLLNRNDDAFRFASFIRNFVWTEPALLAKTEPPEEFVYYPDAQWYIRRLPGLVLAAKGGHNDEPHNHNDVGNFILADAHTQVICDLGSGVYDLAYFTPETRYQIPNNGSFGHSVPLVDGQTQPHGRQRAAQVLQSDDMVFAIEMKDAYGIPELTQLLRTFRVEDGAIKLTDTYAFEDGIHEIAERFIFNVQPEIAGNTVVCGGLEMQIESDEAEITCHKELAYWHSGAERSYYTVDCKWLCRGEGSWSVRFTAR